MTEPHRLHKLLYAAARGARIERLCPTKKEWYEDPVRIFKKFDVEQRIHPDDQHLQYGPISTNLREAAEDEPEWLQDSLNVYAQAVVNDYDNEELGNCWAIAARADLLHKQLFLLLLAEVVADDGL